MTPDVKELAREKLASGTFPAAARADFRLYIAPDVRRSIEQHAKANVAVEICGVLVGRWEVDDDGPYARVTDIIRCENASSKYAEVTVTHESWAQINKEMDSKFADERIIGWYHSHPDFGIFLSDRDCFIQQHFFAGPGQVAYVIDPVRDLEGVFAWRNGKPTLLPHFWIGDRIRTAEASERNHSDSGQRPTPISPITPQPDDSPAGFSMFGLATAALALMVAFWLGHLYGNWRTEWEQRMIRAGAVAYFADTKVIAEGLEGELSTLQTRLQDVSAEFAKLPNLSAGLTKEQAAAMAETRARILEKLSICDAALQSIERRYSLDDVERATLAQIAAEKRAALLLLEDREVKKLAGRKSTDSNASSNPPNAQTDKPTNSPAQPKLNKKPPATSADRTAR